MDKIDEYQLDKAIILSRQKADEKEHFTVETPLH